MAVMRTTAVLAFAAAMFGCPTPAPASTASPAIGPLYFPSIFGIGPKLGFVHYCTAGVVHSSTRDLIITAAHCVYGNGLGIEFAPGYSAGQTPFGTWSVIAAYIDPAWTEHHDPRHDVAILRVAHKKGRAIEDVVGAHVLGTAPAPGTPVTTTGYAVGRNDEPITCTARSYLTDGYPSIDCPGFVNGTSGGPWISGGELVGVIGGLDEGGCTPATSYSSPFGDATMQLLQRAEAGRHAGALFVPPVSSGC